MSLEVGQKVSYPNHGICAVESLEKKDISGTAVECYSLRLIANNSLIMVPKINAENVGIRPIIDKCECRKTLKFLGEEITEIEPDWKLRIRAFTEKVQSSDILAVADALKSLTFLAQIKQLSFREQRLLEKSKFLIVSELAAVCQTSEAAMSKKIDALLAKSCPKPALESLSLIATTAH